MKKFSRGKTRSKSTKTSTVVLSQPSNCLFRKTKTFSTFHCLSRTLVCLRLLCSPLFVCIFSSFFFPYQALKSIKQYFSIFVATEKKVSSRRHTKWRQTKLKVFNPQNDMRYKKKKGILERRHEDTDIGVYCDTCNKK